ncbi:MAG: molybdopterin-dependent oxidoreductase [Actinomycetota bacterium]
MTGGHRQPADQRERTISQDDYDNLSRRSFLVSGLALAGGVIAWRGIQNRPEIDRIPDVLRGGHSVNERIWRGLHREGAVAPTFDYAESSVLRVNGRHGLDDPLDLNTWELQVFGRNGELLGTHGVDDLRALPQTEMTVEHKCIEGWSHIVTWGGVVFRDFVDRLHPQEADAPYVGMSTPDGVYQVGLERDAMMHSQTMLTLDLQREPLDEEHGAPVRLTTPLKYGTKQIKRIGTITFSDTRPEGDYWAERGYDWFSGL